MSSCLHDGPKPVLPTSILRASRRAKSSTSRDTRSSNKMTSADCSARTARSVSSSASPGPAPTRVTEPFSIAAPRPCTSATKRSKSVCVGSLSGFCIACAVNSCQNLRRPENGSPVAFTAARQRAAAAAQSAKPFGSKASSLARIACAKTGAAPSVEMPITKGERLTMAPKAKSQKAGLSITLTGTPAARAAEAKTAAPSSSSKAPMATAATEKSSAVQLRRTTAIAPRGGSLAICNSSSDGASA